MKQLVLFIPVALFAASGAIAAVLWFWKGGTYQQPESGIERETAKASVDNPSDGVDTPRTETGQ